MKMNIEKILKTYKENYVRIFKNLYPTKNSTGFAERNLSVNFSKAVENNYPSATSWFEYQFGNKNNLHYDAVIIIPETKEVLVIESKRFSNSKRKINEIENDMERLNKLSCEYITELDRINNIKEYSLYGVILADLWTETKPKVQIKQHFLQSDFIEKKFANTSINFNNGKYFVFQFNNEKNISKSIINNYNLLAMIWKIK